MIPLYLKQNLLALALHLCPTKRGGFLRSVVQRLEAIAVFYPRTVVFSAAGFCIGKIIDAITGFPLAVPGLLVGGLFGLNRDLNADATEQQVRRIIAEEFQAHFAL